MKRLAIFVDGSNLFYSQRDKLGWWIDWRRFIEYYRNRYDVVEARYYHATREDTDPEEATGFRGILASCGYTLCEKPLKEVFDKYTGSWTRKGNLDVELALDAYIHADSYDVCLLASGDGDFVALVRRLREKEKAIIVVSTSGSVAYELQVEAGPDYQDLITLQSEFDRSRTAVSRPRRSGLYRRRARQPMNVD